MREPLIKELPSSEAIIEVAAAGEVRAARLFLDAARIRRDTLLSQLVESPQISKKVKLDMRYVLGQIAALDWLLKLPDTARSIIEHSNDAGSEG